MKIALVGSSGGHLLQLLVLKQWWSQHDRFWVTFRKEDAISALGGERTYWCHHPTNRNALNLLRNTVLAWQVLAVERPDVIISSGAAVAVPFFYLGKLLGARTVYLEVYDRIDSATMTGRIVYPVADKILVQWIEQMVHFPKADFVGELL